MTPTMTIVVSVAETFLTIFFAFYAFTRTRTLDNQHKGEDQGALKADLHYIKNGIDELKAKQHKTDENHINICIRLAKLEESVKRLENKK